MCFICTYMTHYKTRGNKKERTDNKDKVDEPIWQCVRVYMFVCTCVYKALKQSGLTTYQGYF